MKERMDTWKPPPGGTYIWGKIAAMGGLGFATFVYGLDDANSASTPLAHRILCATSADLDAYRSRVISLAERGWIPGDYRSEDPYLSTEVGVPWFAPIGLSAWTTPKAVPAWMRLGFSYVEVDLRSAESFSAAVAHSSTEAELDPHSIAAYSHLGVRLRPIDARRVDELNGVSYVVLDAGPEFAAAARAARRVAPDVRVLMATERCGEDALRAVNSFDGLVIEGNRSFDAMVAAVTEAHQQLRKVPIVAGPVRDPESAYQLLRAGASAVLMDPEVFWYHGPLAVRGIKSGLSKLILRDGLYSIKEAIGADARVKKKHKRG